MTTASIRFPFSVGARGKVLGSSRHDVIREQIEQVLFTRPGERVGRPEFGCGIELLVFAAADDVTAAAAQISVQKALHRAMRDLIIVDAVRTYVEDTELHIDVLFTQRETGEELHLELKHPLEGPS